MIISNQKYSCEACIRGHRVTTCKHHDRPLTRINRKGRPFSTCTICHRTPCPWPEEHGRLRKEREGIHPGHHVKKSNRYSRPFSGFLPIAPRPSQPQPETQSQSKFKSISIPNRLSCQYQSQEQLPDTTTNSSTRSSSFDSIMSNPGNNTKPATAAQNMPQLSDSIPSAPSSLSSSSPSTTASADTQPMPPAPLDLPLDLEFELPLSMMNVSGTTPTGSTSASTGTSTAGTAGTAGTSAGVEIGQWTMLGPEPEPEPELDTDPKFADYGAFCGWEDLSAAAAAVPVSAFLNADWGDMQKGVGNDDWSAMGTGFWMVGEGLMS